MCENTIKNEGVQNPLHPDTEIGIFKQEFTQRRAIHPAPGNHFLAEVSGKRCKRTLHLFGLEKCPHLIIATDETRCPAGEHLDESPANKRLAAGHAARYDNL